MGARKYTTINLLGKASSLGLSFSLAAPVSAAQAPSTISDEILVIGQRVGSGLRADREVDENGIAAFGVDTVGDLLNAIASEADPSGDGPVILINGEPANGIDDVADLPTEAVSRIQILSRSAASTLGQRPTRRVINVVIRPDHRQATLNSRGRVATTGEGRQAEAEINLLKLVKGSRNSFVLRLISTDGLRESDRGIRTDSGAVPFDPAGNILSFPLTGSEIDPALSAVVGSPVLVAGVPLGTTFGLADFAATAGLANQSDLGRYRTLLPQSLAASANANITRKVGPTTVSLTLRGDRLEGRSRTGPATASLRLAESSPFSPFSRDVTLATILGAPLRQHNDTTSVTSSIIANGPLGRWRFSVNANLNWRLARTVSERGYDLDAYQSALDSGSVSPFLPAEPALLGAALRDRAQTRSINSGMVGILTGSPFTLPAGPAQASLRMEWRGNRARSTTTGVTSSLSRRLHRDELISQATIQLPLIRSPAVGSVGAEFSGALRHVTASRLLHDTGYGLNWQPGERISIRAAVNHERLAPPPNALTDPVVTIDNVRVFDFIRQETILVRFVTGGNPDIGIERRRTITVGGSWRPFERINLDLTADYVNRVGRGAFAGLPPVNASVQAAFPDRFVRDGDGRLIAVDARPVPFARVRREELRTGATVTRTLGRPVAAASGDARDGDLAQGWRVNAFLGHQ